MSDGFKVHYLEGLEPGEDGEVSAVTAGANPLADIVVLKGARQSVGGLAIPSAGCDSLGDGSPTGIDQQEAAVAKQEPGSAAPSGGAQEMILKLDPAQRGEFEAFVQAEVAKATMGLTEQVTKLAAEKADLEKGAVRTKRAKEFRAKLPKGMQAAFEEMSDEEREEMMEKFAKAEASGETDIIAKLAKPFEAVEKKNAELQEQIAKLRDEQDVREAVAKMADIKAQVGDVTKIAKAHLVLAKANREAADDLLGVIKALAEQVKTGKLFDTLGTDAGTGAGSTIAKVKTMAAERVQKSAGGLSLAKATDMILSENPDLYRAYEAERNG